MAKKVTIETLNARLGELEATEQTAKVMEETDVVKAQIDTMDAEAKALADEIARNEAEKTEKAKAKEEKKKGRFISYDVWQLEWKGVGDSRKLSRIRVKKTVKILAEHAATLNEQRENTLFEYVKKEG